MSRRKVMTSGTLLGAAHLLDVVLPLVRNVAIARFMEPREFALSLMLTTVMAIAELVTDTGLSQMAVKVDPSRTRACGTLQSLALLRALFVGGALAAVFINQNEGSRRPDLYAVGAMRTSNGSDGYFAGHSGHYRVTVRYRL